jgi:hypothetical protein
VEKRIRRESDDIEVLVIGQFLIRSGCRRELMSSYIDVKGVGCREINAVHYDRCGEGEDAWLEAQERWAGE